MEVVDPCLAHGHPEDMPQSPVTPCPPALLSLCQSLKKQTLLRGAQPSECVEIRFLKPADVHGQTGRFASRHNQETLEKEKPAITGAGQASEPDPGKPLMAPHLV